MSFGRVECGGKEGTFFFKTKNYDEEGDLLVFVFDGRRRLKYFFMINLLQDVHHVRYDKMVMVYCYCIIRESKEKFI